MLNLQQQTLLKKYFHERFNLSFPSEDRHKVILIGPNQPRDIEFHMTENGGIRRSFQPKWFDMPCAKPWLEYFTKADAMFCFACRLFGAAGGTGQNNEHGWMISGMRGAHWKNALHCIRRHSTSKFHIASMDSWKTYTGKTPIDCMIDEHRRLTVSRREKEIENNRQILFRLLEIIKFLAKQNLHFEDMMNQKIPLTEAIFRNLYIIRQNLINF